MRRLVSERGCCTLPSLIDALEAQEIKETGLLIPSGRYAAALNSAGECFARATHVFDSICYHGPVGEVAMAQYVIEREIPGAGNLSDAELQEVARKSVDVLKGMGPEIKWLHSYVTGDKVYCVYLAPDEETIREHARRVGLPANRISAVRRLMDTSTAG